MQILAFLFFFPSSHSDLIQHHILKGPLSFRDKSRSRQSCQEACAEPQQQITKGLGQESVYMG